MGKLYINQNMLNKKNIDELIKICPFNAIEEMEGKLSINAGCKMCKLCVKKGPKGVIEFIEESVEKIDKTKWKGITVYVDHTEGRIHPVTYELIGKAKELAAKINHPVYAVFIGYNIKDKAEEILYYGVDKVFVYDEKEFKDFRIEPYAVAFEDFINKVNPCAVLVGATTVGRSLAPRVAARFRTGLTADCTVLDMKENTDLVQIRPAFGGNIMAQIVTPNKRPQFCTVRYKIMNEAKKSEKKSGKIIKCEISKEKLKSNIEVLNTVKKEKEEDISEADVIVVAGRGVKTEKDMDMIKELADNLGAQIAGTRPLIEMGWVGPKKQIGLSGRTVKPKLIITCGVSGSVQFIAGMNSSEHIFAINEDPNASIFNVAHYGVVGDIYEVVPQIIKNIKNHKSIV